jgi:Ca2+-binding EF-hand superfamily protein
MKTTHKTLAALAAGAALAVAALVGPALAQPAGDDTLRKTFAQADANGDGMLDLDEYVGHTIFLFRQVDVNRDGSVTYQEAVAFTPTLTEAAFRAADRNGDGKLSVGEAAAAKVIVFFEIDANRDGVITIDELIAHERRVGAAK